jgi:alpha-L-rhamnosidase
VSAASHLRVEHLGDAVLGLGARAPRLSWRLPDGSSGQGAYQLEIAGRILDIVESEQHVLVPWPIEPLGSAVRAKWRVKVWTNDGESGWSVPAWFETGLLETSDWVARWIEPLEPAVPPPGQRPAHALMTSFSLHRIPGRARLYATAHGIYETFLNGRRVGHRELTPGFTSYWANLHVQVFDVAELLVAGENSWRVVLSDGWYRGRHGNAQQADHYGLSVAFLAQLHADDTVVATGANWTSTTGVVRAADLMDGQFEDRRIRATAVDPVRVVDHDLTRLTYSPAPPTRRVQQLRPVSVTRVSAERQIVDLGQNINGWIRLHDLGPAGSDVTMVHGEALDAKGDVTLANLGDSPVRQTDRVISAGVDGDVFEPRHTQHGFQYVRVEGHPHRLTPDDVTGVVVHTDLRRTGWFRCSDERINRFHDIAEWSFRSNATDIPTDCPQRERSGWTGDWQVFIPAAAFLYDVGGFSVKWLRDLAADQLPNGCLANLAPEPRRAAAEWDPRWLGMLGSSGWGDAIAMVPWELWRSYGDADVLAEMWPAMVRWTEFAAEAARTKRNPTRAAARPEPRPHEQYLWDGGWHWGEWHEPGGMGQFWAEDHGAVGTAFLHHTAALVARIGRMLGHDDVAARFESLAANALEAWRIEYLATDGSLTPDTQANHVRALAFRLVPDDLRRQTAARLVELIRNAGTHLGTGFLATPYLLPVLADTDHLDVAFDLLLQNTPPSWLTMVDRGATTVWEAWEGIDADGVAHDSLNHYSKGAVISFLHTHVAGIQLLDEPAYRRFRIAPSPGGGLTWAEAVHDSAHGRIESSWRLDGGRYHLHATVPAGTSAEVVLPDGARHQQGPGSRTYEWEGRRR